MVVKILPHWRIRLGTALGGCSDSRHAFFSHRPALQKDPNKSPAWGGRKTLNPLKLRIFQERRSAAQGRGPCQCLLLLVLVVYIVHNMQLLKPICNIIYIYSNYESHSIARVQKAHSWSTRYHVFAPFACFGVYCHCDVAGTVENWQFEFAPNLLPLASREELIGLAPPAQLGGGRSMHSWPLAPLALAHLCQSLSPSRGAIPQVGRLPRAKP